MNDTGFKKDISVGIVGVSGYGGGEVLRLCATHPRFRIDYVAGESSAGQKLIERFPGIGAAGSLIVQKWNPQDLPPLDLLFASLPTGESQQGLAQVVRSDTNRGYRRRSPIRIRLDVRSGGCVARPGARRNASCQSWVLPRGHLGRASPLAAEGLIDMKGIIIDAKSGVSGAQDGEAAEPSALPK